MNTLVVYDSQFGNTEQISQTIADTARTYGPAQAVRAASGSRIDIEGVTLLLVGSPTQGWKPTRPILSFLEGMTRERLQGTAVACFDTRFRKPRWLTGSAAGVMARKLHHADIATLVPPESFFVVGTQGPLCDGERERAAAWARMLRAQIELAIPAVR